MSGFASPVLFLPPDGPLSEAPAPVIIVSSVHGHPISGRIMNEWELIEAGRFEEAIRRADEEFVKTDDVFHLANKVYALLHLGKYRETVALCKLVIEKTDGISERDFLYCGVAYWLIGSFPDAVGMWQEAQAQKRYTDAAGGLQIPLLLYFAAGHLSDPKLEHEARVRIKKVCRTKRAGANWPGSLGLYVVDQLSEQDLLSGLTTRPILRDRQRCRAHFWIGVKSQTADSSRIGREMHLATSYGPSSFLEFEYYLAKGALSPHP